MLSVLPYDHHIDTDYCCYLIFSKRETADHRSIFWFLSKEGLCDYVPGNQYLIGRVRASLTAARVMGIESARCIDPTADARNVYVCIVSYYF